MAELFTSLEAVSLGKSWLTIGVFDGIHRGHQEIIYQLTAGAHQAGAPAVVLTFHPHPVTVITGRQILCLTTPEERAEILFSLGVDVVILQEFSIELAGHTAENYMANIQRQTGLQNLLIGYDFALGKDRAGTFDRLTQIGIETGFKVSAVEPVQFDGEVISSTLIRNLVGEGKVQEAAEKLGRDYSISGIVISGDGRGRTIGIPTANVDVLAGKVIPKNGVYACWARIGAERHPAVVNIGYRPTFTSGEVLPRIEAHLLDFSSDLYGKKVKLEFVQRLRDEQKFPSVDELLKQINVDIHTARGWMS